MGLVVVCKPKRSKIMPIYRVSFYCQDESKRNSLKEAFINYFLYAPQLNDKICYLYDYEWYIDYESDIKLYELIHELSKCNVFINISEVVQNSANYMKEYLVDDTSDECGTHEFILRVRQWLAQHPSRSVLLAPSRSA